MAHKNIPLPATGIPGFSTQTFKGPQEPLYSGDVPLTTDHVRVLNGGAEALILPRYAVVSYDPATKEMDWAKKGTPAYTVLPAAIAVAAGEEITVPIYREGYFEIAAMEWDESYVTSADKKNSFEGGVNKIWMGEKVPKDDNIVV